MCAKLFIVSYRIMKYADEILDSAEGVMGFHNNSSRILKFVSKLMRRCIKRILIVLFRLNIKGGKDVQI